MKRKLVVFATAAALTALLVAPSGAGAKVKHISSTVTIEFVGDQYGGIFTGTVSSSKTQCVKVRRVLVQTTDAYGNTFIGLDDTNQQGEYFVHDESVTPAKYEAVALKKKFTVKKKHHKKKKFVCDEATSGSVTAP